MRRINMLGRVALSALMLGVLPAAMAAGKGGNWTTTWQASPEPPRSPTITLNGQTVRQVVRISAGGNRFRVRLSNEYGDSPLHIGAAHLAIAAEGAAIKLGSDRTLTFSGARDVYIPEHAYIYSDPVELTLPSLGSMTVSVYLPGNEKTITEHSFAMQTAWVIKGDATGTTKPEGASTITKRALLTGVDVATGGKVRTIVTLGDSITGGFGSTPDANKRWPDQLAERLVQKKANFSVANAGIGGNRLLHDFIGPNAVSRFERDVLSRSGVSHVIVLIGINDFGFPGGRNLPAEEVTLEQMVTGMRQLIERAHEHNIRIIGATLLPFSAIPERPGYYSEASAAKREALNKWIRESGEFDDVIDFDKALRDPRDPKNMLATFDSGDHLDPNDAGYKAMADAIDLKLFK
ncbi:MAG: SGNH/GDSL hydrolase family protein [Pseudomonadota bacterium]